MDEVTQQQLVSLAQEDPSATVTVDLANQTLAMPDGRKVPFPIDGFAKHCLLQGIDQLDYLIGLEDEIAAYETEHQARLQTV